MKIKKHYYLMISCPGDVVDEIEYLKKCVESINSERTDDSWVELRHWITDTSSDAGMMAQDSINEQLVKDSDGLIAIFNARLGTQVHNFRCGTEEEIHLMLEAHKHVSLLFNTQPRIDLTRENCIDQITRLQEFKIDQSKKSYYKEFSDESTFMELARREIRMWLRDLVNQVPSQNTTDQEPSETELSASDEENNPVEVNEDNKENLNTQVSSPEDGQSSVSLIDEEAGTLDCVVYITNAAGGLSSELQNYNAGIHTFNEQSILFNNKLDFLNKQPNSSAGLLILCRNYSKQIDDFSATSRECIEKCEEKWNQIFNYLIILQSNEIKIDDKIILRDSINSLKNAFETNAAKVEELINKINSVPNLQKDVTISLKKMISAVNQFRTFSMKVASNCEELENTLS